jgi:two-component system LytT family response regulator
MIKYVIVDDEPAVFDLIEDLLQNIDNQFKLAGSAKSKNEAIEVIQKNKPDVVFVDINMPRGSGFELLDFFPSREFEVVFITGYSALEPFTKKYPHIGFLTKPPDIDDLKKIVERIKSKYNNEGVKSIQNPKLL